MKLSAELPVSKVEVVEIQIDALRKQYKFGDIVNLRNKKIRIVETFRVTQVPVTNTGNNVTADATYNKSFMVLAIKGREDINRVPLQSFNSKDNFGRRLLLNDLEVDWPKSYIEVGDQIGLTVGESYLVNVYYE